MFLIKIPHSIFIEPNDPEFFVKACVKYMILENFESIETINSFKKKN